MRSTIALRRWSSDHKRRRPGLEPGPTRRAIHFDGRCSTTLPDHDDRWSWVPAQGRDDGRYESAKLTLPASAAGGGGRWPADRRSASDARNRAGWSSALPPQKKNSGLEGSPTGQWQVASLSSSSDSRWLIGTTLSKAIGSGSISTSKAWASAVLPRETGRAPASYAGPGVPCAGGEPPRRGSWRGRKGPADGPCRSRRSASHFRVPRRSGWRKARLPRVSSVVRRDRQTRSIPSSHSFLRVAPADFGTALRVQSSQKSLPAESLSPRRARKARPNVYAEQLRLRGSVLPHEMSYPTGKKLQYGVTPAQESARVRPHVPSAKHCNVRSFRDTGSLRVCRPATG